MGTGWACRARSDSATARRGEARWRGNAAATSTLGDGGPCSPDESARGYWTRGPSVAQGLTGETTAGLGCSTDGTTGRRGTGRPGWLSRALAMASEQHVERRRVGERERRRAHLGGRATALRRDVASTAARWRDPARRCAASAASAHGDDDGASGEALLRGRFGETAKSKRETGRGAQVLG
jgi:hypothetical protein